MHRLSAFNASAVAAEGPSLGRQRNQLTLPKQGEGEVEEAMMIAYQSTPKNSREERVYVWQMVLEIARVCSEHNASSSEGVTAASRLIYRTTTSICQMMSLVNGMNSARTFTVFTLWVSSESACDQMVRPRLSLSLS